MFVIIIVVVLKVFDMTRVTRMKSEEERKKVKGVSTVENKGINDMALLPALLLERGGLAQYLAHVGDADALVGR